MDTSQAKVRLYLSKVKASAGYMRDHAYKPNVLPLAAIGFYTGFIVFGANALGYDVGMGIYAASLYRLTPATVVLAICLACLYVLVRERPSSPTRHLATRLHRDWQIGKRLAWGLPVMILLPPMLSAFTSFKGTIGHMVPFYLDPYAAMADRLIHGTDPWRLLQPFLGHPAITFAISIAYMTWFFAMYIVMSFAMFLTTDLRTRSQYLAAFILCWGLIGSVAAALLSSAGPCFYLQLYGGHEFDGLMAYLDQANAIIPNHVREVQAGLLAKFNNRETAFAAGISAMPSLHVGIAVLNGIYLSRVNRYAAIAAWAFAFVIFIGSIHLGWHYAVDGYVSAILVVLIWKMCGWLTGRLMVLEAAAAASATGAEARSLAA